MGMITSSDAVIALSNSGAVPEILTLLPLLKRLGVPLVSMTGNPQSPLGQASDVHLNTGVEIEACPLDLAPTSSTTTALVMGDALAIALLEARGFTADDFAFSHPGGTLGRQLLLKVQDVMKSGEDMPLVKHDVKLSVALLEISKYSLLRNVFIEDNSFSTTVVPCGEDVTAHSAGPALLAGELIIAACSYLTLCCQCPVSALVMQNKLRHVFTMHITNQHKHSTFPHEPARTHSTFPKKQTENQLLRNDLSEQKRELQNQIQKASEQQKSELQKVSDQNRVENYFIIGLVGVGVVVNAGFMIALRKKLT
jgi:hypothetical protein